MSLNREKTKVMECNYRNSRITKGITLGRDVLMKVKEFSYFGSLMTRDGRSKVDLKVG